MKQTEKYLADLMAVVGGLSSEVAKEKLLSFGEGMLALENLTKGGGGTGAKTDTSAS